MPPAKAEKTSGSRETPVLLVPRVHPMLALPPFQGSQDAGGFGVKEFSTVRKVVNRQRGSPTTGWLRRIVRVARCN